MIKALMKDLGRGVEMNKCEDCGGIKLCDCNEFDTIKSVQTRDEVPLGE